MAEISFEYWNKLANQIIMISSLLGGFSLTIIANILVSKANTPIVRKILIAATLAGSFFLISVFAMTKLLMITTDGYPLVVTSADLMVPRIIGTISFFFGIFSLIAIMSLAGWTKSKTMGKFTTTLGIVTLVVILLMVT
jgi:hypothetical protein